MRFMMRCQSGSDEYDSGIPGSNPWAP